MAPELFRNDDYDTKVDVFSFALILQEVNIYFYFSLLSSFMSVCMITSLDYLDLVLLPHSSVSVPLYLQSGFV